MSGTSKLFDEATILRMIKNTTQAECREIGELFVRLADAPRDAGWQSSMRRALAQFPAAPASDLAQALQEGRKRVARRGRRALGDRVAPGSDAEET